jgi:general secretion pathway protein L
VRCKDSDIDAGDVSKLASCNGEVAPIFILSDLWAWWVQQMTDMLPTWLVRRPASPATALVIAPGSTENSASDTVTLSARRHRREQVVGRFVLDEPGYATLRQTLARRGRRVPVLLRVSPDLLLEREVNLPLATEPDVGNALRFGIDALTPFTAEELFWSWAIMLRDRAHGRLHVRLSLVRKAAVEKLIAALERAGAAPKLLEILLSDTDTRTIPLAIAPGGAASRGFTLRRGLAGLGGLGAGVALALAVLPVVLQMRASAATEAQIAALQPRVAQVVALRRASGNTDGDDAIARERTRVGDALQVLAIVTDALPDDTYLIELSLRQRKLALTGQSGAAAKVIVALSAEPMLHKTEFVAPVTRAPTGGRDVFSIAAEVVP